MRLSRPRVLLRIALLVVGGVFMLVRAAQLHRATSGADAPGGLGSRLALIWALMGALALVTAGMAAWSLVRPPPRRTLRLDDLGGRPARPDRGDAEAKGERTSTTPRPR